MNSTRILVTQQSEVLTRALSDMLLVSQATHELISSTAQNIEEFMTETSGRVPNVMVLGESTPLAARETLAHLLTTFPMLRVIVISNDTNWLQIYSKKVLLMTRNSDLLQLIDGE